MTLDVRALAGGVALGILAAVAFYETRPASDPPPVAGAATTAAPQPRPSLPTRPDCDALRVQNQLLRGQLAMERAVNLGTPVPWPADTPFDYTPEGFQRRVAQAIEDCAPDVDIVGIDCAEPPCLAQLRTPDVPGEITLFDEQGWWNRVAMTCPHWTDAYGEGGYLATHPVECEDGDIQQVTLLGWATRDDVPGAPQDEDATANQERRLDLRRRMAVADWPCER